MRRIVFVAVILYVSRPAVAADMSGLSAAVDAVLSHNSGMKAAQAQVRQAEAGQREAQAMRLPMLSARSQATRGDNPVYVFGSLMEQGRFGPENFAIDQLNHPGDLTNIQSGLDLGVPLFTGFELTSAARLSELAQSQARNGYEGTAQQLRFQAASLYLQLMFDRDVLKSLDERISVSDNEVADARKLKEKGVVFGSDYYAAEAIYGGLKGWRIQVQTDQTAALSKLALLSGREDWQPKESMTDKTLPVDTKANLETAALLKRPDLLAAASQVSMAEVNRRQANRSLLPKVQAFASLETNTNDFSSNPSNHTFGVSAKLPFGDPAYFARQSRSLAAQESAEESRKELEESIRIEVAQAYDAYQGALAALPVAKDTLDRAAKSLDLFRPLYHSGRQSIIEVLRAEEGLAKAQTAYLQALFQAHTSYLRLQATAGSLDEKAIDQVSQLISATKTLADPPSRSGGEVHL